MPDKRTARAATKLGRVVAEGLNEYAALEDDGGFVLGHSPGSPMFWFHGLARDSNVSSWGPNLRGLLTESALCKATCAADNIHGGTFCYACSFGCHDRCAYGCGVGDD